MLTTWRRLAFALLLTGLGAAGAAHTEMVGLDRFEHFTSRDGLAHDWVTKMAQDSQGFLWIGTSDGLSRFDGYQFVNYRHDPLNPATLSNNFIVCILEDQAGDLWIGTKIGLNRFDRLTQKFERFVPDPTRPESLSHDFVTDVAEDLKGRLWVATTGGLNRLDRETGEFTQFPQSPDEPDTLAGPGVMRLHRSRNGDLWVSVGRWLHRLDRQTDRFERFSLTEDVGPRVHVHILAEDETGTLWAGTRQGDLVSFDPQTRTHTHYPLSESGILFVGYVFPRPDGTLWLGTRSHGILAFDPASRSWTAYRHHPDEPGSLSANRIMSVYEDRGGVLWIATTAGLDKLDPSKMRFQHYRRRPGDPTGLSGNRVSSILEDSRGDLWVGTFEGLNHVGAEGRVTVYRHDPADPTSLGNDHVSALFEDHAGMIWLGTDRGIFRLDPGQRRFLRPGRDFKVEGSLQSSLIYHFIESEPGILWIGGAEGFSRYDTKTGKAQLHLPQKSVSFGPETNFVYDLKIDRFGDLWLITGGSGIYRLRRTPGGQLPASPELELESYRHDINDPTSISSNYGTVIFEDRAGTLWVGTHSGLNRVERGNDPNDPITFTRFREADGRADHDIMSILEDERGNLWLGGGRGLTRLDPQAKKSRLYTVDDGLLGNDFSFAETRRANGAFLFGGTAGLISFLPEHFADDTKPPPVAITDFRLVNASYPMSARGFSNAEPRLTFSHQDNIFSFEFAALHFAKPNKNQYAYRLENFNDDWIQTDARNRTVQYTNLDPGDYVFQVKAANADGAWNEEGAAIHITVEPPPWQTWWAYSIYFLTLLGVVLSYVRSHRRELQRERKVAETERQAAENERQVSQRLREVDRLKDEFLANTSHELRTPLYGMTGIAESLVDGARGPLPEPVRNDLSMVAASGQRLSHLVNDILDFSKLRHKSLELQRRPVDLKPIAEIVLTLSNPLAGSKDLVLVNEVPADLPAVDADENRLQQILYNLVGNAIKFTESGSVTISALAVDDELQIHVSDTGIGIAEEHQERIFQAFEQADASTEREHGGTGLGLTVTRQLIELHGGEIEMESTLGEGSTFSFSLPLANVSPMDQPATTESSTVVNAPVSFSGEIISEVSAADSATGPRILVVDDEPVNLQVVRNYLALENFDLTTAVSGEEALRLLDEQKFDLVLLDIMMPKISGYEVCRRLREQHPISDLPVIFLTAKAQDSDVVTGMSLGANDYLAKPISKNRLLARVRPHLDLLEVHRGLEGLVAEKMSEIKILEGILPICASCKRIRDENNRWSQLEVYIDEHSEAQFSHGMCPDCVQDFYDGLEGEDS